METEANSGTEALEPVSFTPKNYRKRTISHAIFHGIVTGFQIGVHPKKWSIILLSEIGLK